MNINIYAVICTYNLDNDNFVRFFDSLDSAKKVFNEIVQEEIEESTSKMMLNMF